MQLTNHKKKIQNINIQNNHYFLKCMEIAEFLFNDDSRCLLDIKDNLKPVISQLSGNYFGTDYASNSFTPMLANFLVNN